MEVQALLGGLCFAALLSQGISYPYNDIEHCFDGKNYQAKLYKKWTDSVCYDLEGNQYKDGAILLSCCGCLKLTCVTKDVTGHFYPTESYWNLTKEDSCCKDCHGTVFPAGAIMNVTEEGGICETTRTTRCVYVDDKGSGCEMVNINYPGNDIPDGNSTQINWQSCRTKCQTNQNCTHWSFRDSDGNCWLKDGNVTQSKENGLVSGPRDCSGVKGGAVAEVSYGFKNCCTDDTGRNDIDDSKWEPKTCSKRTCELPQGNKFASWISKIEKPGCDCCLVDEALIADGEPCPIPGEPNAKCCKGQCLVPVD